MDGNQEISLSEVGDRLGWTGSVGADYSKTGESQTNRISAPESSVNGNGDTSWNRVLQLAGFDAQAIATLARAARKHGTGFHDELAAAGKVHEDRFYRALATVLGVQYCEFLDPEKLVIRDQDLMTAIADPSGPKIALYRTADASNHVLASPALFDFSTMQDYLKRYPAIAGRFKIVAPHTLRKALLEKARVPLVDRATSALFERYPHYSARIVANAPQGFGLGLFAAIIITGLFLYPAYIIGILHSLFSICFLSCVLLRLLAAMGTKPPVVTQEFPDIPDKLPVYSVLVALYKEADVVPDLLAALDRIVWPRSKLEIKLVLEEDDLETRQVLEAQDLRSNIEILTVPNLGPRTKPKALSYAIPVISGDYVAVYDAEDTPHPGQLLEAWKTFQDHDDTLACVQAPLRIRNGSKNLLTKLFAFEYSALFNGLLPSLAKRNLFFPLGGTSNHFRVSTLRQVCDWDPFNVTEDADLAMRLARFGYRMSVITCPTLEDAPDSLKVWICQRTRWFKGWMQTLLVHGRNPFASLRDMRALSYIVSQILLFGIIVSSISYIIIIAVLFTIFYKIFYIETISSFESILLFVDSSNVLLGFSAFLLLGWRTLRREERKGFWKVVLATPFYWFVMSIASWRAAWQLYWQPFLWEKTPHRKSDSSHAS